MKPVKQRFIRFFLVPAILCSLIISPQMARATQLPFTDVDLSAWYGPYVEYAYEAGLMSGTGATTFEPNAETTRAMVVTILHNLEGKPQQKSGTLFPDVPRGKWYSPAVSWASAYGIVSGYPNGLFGTNDPITREQLVTILYNYTQKKGFDVSKRADLSDYIDGAYVSRYARETVSWAVAENLITGTAPYILLPGGYATRAQIATVLKKYCTDYLPFAAQPVDVNDVTIVDNPAELGFKAAEMAAKYAGKVDTSRLSAADKAAGRDTGRLVVGANTVLPSIARFRPVEIVRDQNFNYIIQFQDAQDAIDCEKYLQTLPIVNHVEVDVLELYDPIDPDDGTVVTNPPGTHYSWGVSAIGADTFASDLIANGKNRRITVAVVDSGVDSTHPLLRGRLLTGIDLVDRDTTPQDEDGHGTHVAGTIVDCTPGLNVRILPIRIFDRSGYTTPSMVAQAIRHATNAGVDVINLSLGGDHYLSVESAIEDAVNKGITVVVAAGNESTDVRTACPAHISSCITVAAVGSNLQRAYFSNYGSALDISAPGVNITSSRNGGGYISYSGTSMAAPHAAAAAAMILMYDPALVPSQVEQFMRTSAIDLGTPGWDAYYGAGMLHLSYQEVNDTLPDEELPDEDENHPGEEEPGADEGDNNDNHDDSSMEEICTISFRAEPGYVTPMLTEVIKGQPIGELPTPRYSGYHFLGWYTKSQGGDLVTSQTIAANSVAIYAHWMKPELTISATDVTLNVGDTFYLTATTNPAGQSVSWESWNTSVATVTNGRVYAASAGMTRVTAKFIIDGYTFTQNCTITVVEPEPAEKKLGSIGVTATSTNLKVGETMTVTAEAYYQDGTHEDITALAEYYPYNNQTIATCNGNQVTAIGKGTVLIMAKYNNFVGYVRIYVEE